MIGWLGEGFKVPLLSILLAVIGGTAVLTPLVFVGVESLAGEGRFPFSRVFDRVFLLCFIIGLVQARRTLAPFFTISKLRRCYRWSPVVDVVAGIVISVVPSLLVLNVLELQGVLLPRHRPAGYFLQKAFWVVPGAIFIAVVEEVIFRVWLLDYLRERVPIVAAIILSSLIFGIIHLTAPAGDFVVKGYQPLAGLYYLGAIGGQAVSAGFFAVVSGLVVIGVILAVARWWGNSLFLAFGLHGGWILVAKLTTFSMLVAPELYVREVLFERYFLLMQPPVYVGFGITACVVGVLAWSSVAPRIGTEEVVGASA